MLPQLRRLEETFPDDVAVIGVHAPKFPAEHDPAHVRAAALSFGITHPVVNDPDHRLWDAYAVRAWPTLVFVDPRGYVIGQHAGELHFPTLGEVVDSLLRQVRQAGLLGYEEALPVTPEPYPSGTLAFPGAVLADPQRERLIIADTGHHRLVMTDLAGKILRTIGRGTRGFSNGNGAAGFDSPRGMALDGDTLYVADTENHAIRSVDLASGQTRTVAGTGEQARRLQRGGPARESALSSPWDLALSSDGSTLFIAMAGFHQIWALDLASMTIGPYAGTGHEGIKDAERQRAWLAQPSGVSVHGDTLYVADSETSAIRAIDTRGPSGAVRTLAGHDLFVFGDQDGPGPAALLQHPLGVCADGQRVWVADSYNDKLRVIDIKDGWVRTAAGNGEHGLRDGVGEAARLWEPSSISAHGDILFIADTNNHAIRRFDTRAGELTTLNLT